MAQDAIPCLDTERRASYSPLGIPLSSLYSHTYGILEWIFDVMNEQLAIYVVFGMLLSKKKSSVVVSGHKSGSNHR